MDRVGELVLKLGGSLRCDVSIKMSRGCEASSMYLLLNLAGNLRVGSVGNTLAAFVLHVDRCGGVVGKGLCGGCDD